VRRAAALAAAAAVYSLAAWSVRPGFYDGPAGPFYAYVSPPPIVAAINVPPTSGSGDVGAAGGDVTTRDQPIAQAGIHIPRGALPGPATIQISPSAPPTAEGVTLTGNVYCITATTELGAAATVTLLVPVAQAFPSAMYFAPNREEPAWTSLGGTVDQATYLWSASTARFGCFALGYPTPKPGLGPTLGGSLLPLVTAVLIAAVILAGLPLGLRRRSRRRG
jgi:hypothetical protein